MFGPAITISILYYFVLVIWQYTAEAFHNRPIVLGAVIGLLLGDIPTGCMMGAALEMIFMGATFMGGTLPTDATLATMIAVPMAILTDISTEAAIALAVPVGLVGVATETAMKLVYAALDPIYEKMAHEGNQKAFSAFYMFTLWAGQILNPIITFIALYVGADAIGSIVANLPESFLNAIEVVGGMLPAVGLGLILNMLFSWRYIIYFVVGFAGAAFYQINVVLCLIIAAVFVCLELFLDKDGGNANAAPSEGEEDFLDE